MLRNVRDERERERAVRVMNVVFKGPAMRVHVVSEMLPRNAALLDEIRPLQCSNFV